MSGKLVIEIIDPLDNPMEKFVKGVAALSKATGTYIHLAEESKAEPTPYTALRELGDKVFDEVEAGISEIWLEIQKKWLRTETSKAESMYKLNGKTFLNPKTGRPLTIKEWKVIQKDLERVFGKLYASQQNAMLNQAVAMGKILRNMEPIARIAAPLASLGLDLFSKVVSADDEYRNIINWATVHTGELIQEVTNRSRKSIVEMIMQGYQDKVGQRELESRLFDKMSDLNKDWRRIAETETATNFNNGYLQATLEDRRDEEEPIFMLGISGAGACDFCRTHVDGQVVVLLKEAPGSGEIVTVDGREYVAIWGGKNNYGRKRADWWVSAGTQHPNCILPGNEITVALPSTVFKSFYEGRIIEISLTNGYSFTIAENHPVLTPNGFIAAKFLCEGTYVFSNPHSERVMQSINPDYYQGPILIEDFYSAALHASSVPPRTMPVSTEDFYGDGGSIKGDVHVVNAYGLLGSNIEAALLQHRYENALSFSDQGKPFTPNSFGKQTFPRYLGASKSYMSFLSEKFSLLQGSGGHSGIHALTSIPWSDSSFDKTLAKGGSTHTDFSREFLTRFSSNIALKNSVGEGGVFISSVVSHVDSYDYSGNVYDVTDDIFGLYTCNGVIVKNCRCTWTEYDMRIAAYEKKLRAAAGS